MLVSDDFILINLPKTGSSFSRNAIKQVHHKMKWDLLYRLKSSSKSPRLDELQLPNIRAEYHVFEKDQHGVYSQIPTELVQSKRKIVSVVRDPIEAYLSRYYFKSYKWVAENNGEYKKRLLERMPSFPEIDFETYFNSFGKLYVDIGFEKLGLKPSKNLIGMLSFQFIQFYAKDPILCLNEIEELGADLLDLEKHFPKIEFIHNENLSESLVALFKSLNYSPKHYRFILNKERVNVTARDKEKSELLSLELLNEIGKKEALMYRFFPVYKEALDLVTAEISNHHKIDQ